MQGSFSVGLWFPILAMVAASGLHTGFMGDISLNFDVATASQIIGPLALVFALSVNSRGIGSNFLLVVFTPIICGLLFSWGELVIEFDPHTASKGWGILWFLFAYADSLRSTPAMSMWISVFGCLYLHGLNTMSAGIKCLACGVV